MKGDVGILTNEPISMAPTGSWGGETIPLKASWMLENGASRSGELNRLQAGRPKSLALNFSSATTSSYLADSHLPDHIDCCGLFISSWRASRVYSRAAGDVR
jgi:hypothetical protein